jgi:hypothetical protein
LNSVGWILGKNLGFRKSSISSWQAAVTANFSAADKPLALMCALRSGGIYIDIGFRHMQLGIVLAILAPIVNFHEYHIYRRAFARAPTYRIRQKSTGSRRPINDIAVPMILVFSASDIRIILSRLFFRLPAADILHNSKSRYLFSIMYTLDHTCSFEGG